METGCLGHPFSIVAGSTVAQELAITLAHLRDAAELYRQLARARRDASEGHRREADLAALDAEYADDQARAAELRRARSVEAARLEDELQTLEARLRDRRACRPADAATQEAVIRDVATMRRRRDAIEQQLLDLWQEPDADESAATRQDIAGRQGEQTARWERAERARPEIERDLEHLLSRLPTRIARQLQRAAGRLDQPIADLVQGACDACGYAMPAQDAINADREAELINCQGCGRHVVPRSSRKTRDRG